MNSAKFNIADGPSKFELMVSLFDGKLVKFTQSRGSSETTKNVIEAVLQSVEKEDGSLDSWNIRILIIKDESQILRISKIYPAYYCSRTRRGVINVINYKS